MNGPSPLASGSPPPSATARVSHTSVSAIWTAVAVAAVAVIATAVLVTPPRQRLLVLGLALVAVPVAVVLDWLGTRTSHRDAPGSPLPAVPLPAAVERTTADDAGGEIFADAVLDVDVLTWPKDGNAESENEDGHAEFAASGWAAVSDGASSSVCAREWARALTTAFVTRRPSLSGVAVRHALQEAALEFTPSGAGDPDSGDGGEHWWSADALRSGAFAALLGFHAVRSASLVRWEAVAIGDSVVVQTRAEPSGPRMVEGFPLESSLSFGGAPSLIGSVPARDGQFPAVRLASGTALATDRWLLLTDELAKWAFNREERGEPVWSLLLDGTQDELTRAIAAARASGEMANDDLTVSRISLR